MSKKKKLLRKTRHTKTYDTETGPITEMEGITVTPDGNGIGEPATSDDMIPEGAELSDAERHELEGRLGAAYMNSALSRASSWMAPMFIGGMPGVGPAFNVIMGAKQLSDDAGVTGAFQAYAKGFSDYWKQNPNENIVSRIWNADDAGGELSKKDLSNIFYRVSDAWNKDKIEAVGQATDGAVNLATILPVVGGMFRGVKYRGPSTTQTTPLMLEGPLSKKASSNLFLEEPNPNLSIYGDHLIPYRKGAVSRPVAFDNSAELTHGNVLASIELKLRMPVVYVGNKPVNGMSIGDNRYTSVSKLILNNLIKKIGRNGIILDATRYSGQTMMPEYTTITTTKSKLPNLLKSFGIKDTSANEFVDPDTGQKIKINIIEDTGLQMHDMYSFAFPRKYRQFAIKYKNELLLLHPDGENLGETMHQKLDMSPDELFNYYLKNSKLQDEYTTYLMGVGYVDGELNKEIELSEDKNLLWKNFIVNTPWYSSALSRKKILLTGENFTPWIDVKLTLRMPEMAKILGYPYSLKTSPYARKNIHDMTELFLTAPYRVIRPANGIPFDERFVTSSLGTNVTGNANFHEDAIFGNTLSGSDRTGVNGVLAASIPVKIKGISDVKKLLNILQEKGFDEGIYKKFSEYSERLDLAVKNHDFDEIEKICLEADKLAENSGLYVKLGRAYYYNQEDKIPRFIGMTRRMKYSLPVLLGKSHGSEPIPMFSTLTYPRFYDQKLYTFDLPEGFFRVEVNKSNTDFKYTDLLTLRKARNEALRYSLQHFNEGKGLRAYDDFYSDPIYNQKQVPYNGDINIWFKPVDLMDRIYLRRLHSLEPKGYFELADKYQFGYNFGWYKYKAGTDNVYGVPIDLFLPSSRGYKNHILKTGKKFVDDFLRYDKIKKDLLQEIKNTYPNLSDQDVSNVYEMLVNRYIELKKTPTFKLNDYREKKLDIDDLKKNIEYVVKQYIYKDFGK